MATAFHSATRQGSPSIRWDLHTALLAFCGYAIGTRLFVVWTTGGWADRSQFFGEGDLKPGIVDFIFNEIMVYYLVIRIIMYRPSFLVYGLLILSSFSYYTRVPLILMFFAIVLSKLLSNKVKFIAGFLVLVLSFVLLYLRIGEDLIYKEETSTFYIGYALIGLGRLWQVDASINATAIHFLTVFIKPLDAIMFLVDYIGNYNGEFSAGRFAGIELSQFEYIQSLQGAYNAFGTVLYPFIYIGGWVTGPLLFLLFLIFQYMSYTFATEEKTLGRRYISFLLVTGVFFSWTSPFAWLAPFIFTKFRNRNRG